MQDANRVYLLWAQYSFGDCQLLGIYKTKAAAEGGLKKLFTINGDQGNSPEYMKDGEAFSTEDGKEYYIDSQKLLE